MEPFVLLLVAQGPTYGYKLIGDLNEVGVAPKGVHVSMVYRTLRNMDAEGLVTTAWGPETDQPRREYELTDEGACPLAAAGRRRGRRRPPPLLLQPSRGQRPRRGPQRRRRLQRRRALGAPLADQKAW